MGRSSKKPRKNKLDPYKHAVIHDAKKKKEQDWTFEDVLRSKPHRR